MLPMLVHHCSACNYNTPVAFSASVFSQDQYCSHCSAHSHGIALQVPAVDASNRPDQQPDMQQDELSRLFAQSLTFAPAPAPSPTPPPEPIAQPDEAPKRPTSEPIVYVSTHYNHSRHVAPVAPRMASPPLEASSHLERTELENILVQNSINPSALFPSQLTLFQYADSDQRLRLLELWRICPPAYAEHEKAWETGVWPDTSLQQEEAMARIRYEKMMAGRRFDPHFDTEDAMTDAPAPVAPPVQPVTHEISHMPRGAEPYMVNGYEMLAKREYEEQARMQTMMQEGGVALQETTRYNQATDPVYLRPVSKEGGVQMQDMENQYGAFEAMRQGVNFTDADHEMMM
ncbi:hypothetical protein NA57DRAFT_76443 [Rhizodiscina lignyota]|uniref:Uncharacterized protein n=1 Tax=Rhizodiscina lignyota TaxID=1504668 RepID=A0A9P4IHD5_9PEZI|nr:hypothetical protein NA57DRAFT_76443 [Rhizodiscina lignyota]